MSDLDNRRLHHSIDFIGMRAQATAVGLVQLSIELRRVGVLDEAALDRIKQAIADEISFSRPRSASKDIFAADVRGRLDRIFSGTQRISDLPQSGDDGTTTG